MCNHSTIFYRSPNAFLYLVRQMLKQQSWQDCTCIVNRHIHSLTHTHFTIAFEPQTGFHFCIGHTVSEFASLFFYHHVIDSVCKVIPLSWFMMPHFGFFFIQEKLITNASYEGRKRLDICAMENHHGSSFAMKFAIECQTTASDYFLYWLYGINATDDEIDLFQAVKQYCRLTHLNYNQMPIRLWIRIQILQSILSVIRNLNNSKRGHSRMLLLEIQWNSKVWMEIN